ncbi:MAG: DMT family transporter [Planktomarina sp.]
MTQNRNSILVGAPWALLAAFVFSVNDMLIKFLSDGYALHQIVFTRSLVGVLLLTFVVIPLAGGFRHLRTRRLGLHVVRAFFVVGANLFFYMALADLPLASVVGIFFVAPFLITIFSVIFLGETVGPWRWFAIGAGLLGVLMIVRPGSDAFSLISLLPLLAASCYAAFHIMTRKIGPEEHILSLTFYVPVVFLCVTTVVGLTVGHGGYAGTGNASLEFLLRAWTWPNLWDLSIMVLIGVGVTAGGAAISQAYRVADAALIAPFEYTALIYAATFGFVLFGEWPDTWAWAGIALVLGSGLVMVWREAVNARVRVAPPNSPR